MSTEHLFFWDDNNNRFGATARVLPAPGTKGDGLDLTLRIDGNMVSRDSSSQTKKSRQEYW